METPVFFNSGGFNLFGVMHEPEMDVETLQTTGLVFCHPFEEEKLISHRVMVNLARNLCKEGYYVFRFDYMGHGDSECGSEEATVETYIADTFSAINYLSKTKNVENVGLMGVRFGATIAALVGSKMMSIPFLVLIEPVIRGDQYVDQCLRSNLATQMACYRRIMKTRGQLVDDLLNGISINVNGYLLSRELYFQMREINLLNMAPSFRSDAFIVQLSRSGNDPLRKPLSELSLICKKAGIHTFCRVIKEAPFWSETKIYNPVAKNLGAAMVEWLGQSLSQPPKHKFL